MAALAYRERELEAFIAFLGGLLATGLLALAMAGIGMLTGVEAGPLPRRAAAVVLGAAWVSITLGIYLRLIARSRTRTRTRS